MRKIIRVKPLSGRRLELKFDNGVEGTVDLSYLDSGVFAPFQDPDFFGQVTISPYGAVEWPNGVDICPDALYYEMTGEPLPFRLPEETPAV